MGRNEKWQPKVENTNSETATKFVFRTSLYLCLPLLVVVFDVEHYTLVRFLYTFSWYSQCCPLFLLGGFHYQNSNMDNRNNAINIATLDNLVLPF
jgi:hypothetical protein